MVTSYQPFNFTSYLQDFHNEHVKNKMPDKNKLILIYYVNIGSMSMQKVSALVHELEYKLERNFDDSVKCIVVPRKDGPTEVDYINSERLSEDAFIKLQNNINEFKKYINHRL